MIITRVNNLILLTLFVSLHLPLSSWAAEPEPVSANLSKHVQEYSLTANNFLEGLTRVASEFRVPLGIEWVNTSASRTEFTLHWKDATVEDILRGIARTQPGYEVKIAKDIVHIYPTGLSQDQNFLHIEIKSFVVHEEVVQLAERRLRDLVMLTTVPHEPGPAGGVGHSLAVSVSEPRINLQAKDASVQDILDLLSAVSAKKIWVVTFVDNPAPTATGFRRTMTLWSKSPVPDDQQPVWNMFGWNESLPRAGLEVQ